MKIITYQVPYGGENTGRGHRNKAQHYDLRLRAQTNRFMTNLYLELIHYDIIFHEIMSGVISYACSYGILDFFK